MHTAKALITVFSAVGMVLGGCAFAQKPVADPGGPVTFDDASFRHLTLDEVARRRYETNYDEIAAVFGGPMSRAPVVSVKAHPEIVWVRPDMGVGMVANPIAIGIGANPSAVPWSDVRRTLARGYLPIVTSNLRQGPIIYEECVHSSLLNGGQVVTGHEKQIAIVRFSVTNAEMTGRQHAVWWIYAPARVETSDGPPFFWSYKLFNVTGHLPAVQAPAGEQNDVIRNGTVLLGVHEEGPGVKATSFGSALRVEADLLAGQKKSIFLKVSTNSRGVTPAELQVMRSINYYSSMDRRVADLENILEAGTKIHVPEEVVNNIYKAQILYNQTQMVQAADREYYMPVQGSNGVWPWEQMKQLVSLDSLGYHRDVERSLSYLLLLQGTKKPPGQIASSEGAFGGTGRFEQSGWENDAGSTIYGLLAQQRKSEEFPEWSNNTGTVLYALGEHYFYTRDKAWLLRHADSIVKACQWIIRARHQTMQNTGGVRPLHYGLMPAGEADDRGAGNPTYNIFTDAYTYQGLQRAAEALDSIKHPDGHKLLVEAAEYRADIVEMLRKTKRDDPDASPYPQRLYQPDDYSVFTTGPQALVDTGLLDPLDPVYPQVERYLKQHTNDGVLGLMGKMPPQGRPLRAERYMMTAETPFHYALIVRGDIEKAILVFYSMLAYAIDHDTLGAVERFDLLDRRYAPFFIDSSGGMRVCDAIRRTVLLEKEGELRILPAAPRRWLEAGKRIVVEGAATYFGKADIVINSKVDSGSINVDLNLTVENAESLRSIIVRVPHPDRRPMRGVTVNGDSSRDFDAQSEIIRLNPSVKSYHIKVMY